MVADGDAVEADRALTGVCLGPADLEQAEIGGAAADVADQDALARLDAPIPVVAGGVDPGVEGGLGLFEQQDARQPGVARRLHRELAGDLVERGRHGEHHVLLGQRVVREGVVPGGADVRQVAAADRHR